MVTVYNENSKKTGGILAVIIFLIVGLVFAAVGTFVMISENEAKERLSVSITGELVSTGEHQDDDGNWMYSPTYSYVAGGQELKCKSSASTSIEPSETTDVFYDPTNVKDCQTSYSRNGTFILYIVFIGLGGVFVIFSIVAIVISIIKRQKA